MCFEFGHKHYLSNDKVQECQMRIKEHVPSKSKEFKKPKHSKNVDYNEMIDSLIQSNNEELHLDQQELSLIVAESKSNNLKKQGQKQTETMKNFFNFIMINEYISINSDVDAILLSLTTKTVKYLHKKRLEERGYRMTNKKLGEGGYGSVYKIYLRNVTNDGSQNVARPLACKIMLLSSRKDKSTALENFSNEIYTMKTCSKHMNIVSLEDNFIYSHAVNSEDILMSHSYIIMEYARMGTLWAKLKKYGPFDENVSKEYFKQIANGLHYLHQQGIAHRDLKLGNILLTNNEKCQEIVKLADFGLSRLVNSKESGLVKFSKPAGTLAYMSPQILTCYINANSSNHQKTSLIYSYDPFKADIWALGVCLYLLLSKIHPFDNPPPNKEERVIFARKMLEKQIKKEWRIMNDGLEQPIISPWSIVLLDKIFEPSSRKRINIYDVIKCLDFKKEN